MKLGGELDTLRNLFGNATATILRLVLVVGTMAAVYFFIVKPTLETTEKVTAGFNNSINGTINNAFNQANNGQNDISQQIQRQIQQSIPDVPPQRLPNQVVITRTIQGLSPQEAQRFAKCLQRARGRVPVINRCFRRFSRK